jgi:hypothetical protein
MTALVTVRGFKVHFCRWVAISFVEASRLKVPGRCIIDSSKSDDLVWLDKRRLMRQIRRLET